MAAPQNPELSGATLRLCAIMDDIVRQAMQKWPNVPHCYGWLALDHRGVWRMRDAHAQQHNLPGDKITHTALIAFINRNYTHDNQGNWYFQNGPQRVYVDLARAPYILHTEPTHGLVTQTQETLSDIDSVWMNAEGVLFIMAADKISAVSDLDMAECLSYITHNGQPVDDAALLDWLDGQHHNTELVLALPNYPAQPIQYLGNIAAAQQFGFTLIPRA
jgi:hypothetical protein